MHRLIVAAVLIVAPAALLAQASSPAVTTALADPARPAADKARDAARKPAELLAFAGIKPGDKVADFIMGGGYLTRILARTVGDAGKVYAYQPAEFIAFRAAYGTDQDTAVAGYANVTASREGLATVAFPEPLDAIVTVQNYHDLHLKMAPPGSAAFITKRLYDALKPGGVFLVVDHAAVAGADFAVADTLHRIDPAKARAEIESVGFTFEGESAMYANPADPRTAIVFDPGIRGKTAQFVYKFRKPK